MAEPVQAESDWKPPYVPYTTLINFIEKKLGGGVLPPRIDNGFLESYAGSVRPLLMSTLRTMGMINETGALLGPMKTAAINETSRRGVMKEWAIYFYADQQRLAAENATAQMLWESFSKHGYSGSTLRKSIVFYLALVEDVGLVKSPYFKAPKQAAPGASTSRRNGARTGDKGTPGKTPPPVAPPATDAASGETVTVSLGSAGSVVVNVGVRWLDLDDATFIALRKAISDLKSLESSAASSSQLDDEEEDNTEEDES